MSDTINKITIRRFNGTNWDNILFPKTSTDMIYSSNGTTNIFSNNKLQKDYIDLATDVYSSGDNAGKPVTSSAVASKIASVQSDITAQLEGKTSSFTTQLYRHGSGDNTKYYLVAGVNQLDINSSISWDTSATNIYFAEITRTTNSVYIASFKTAGGTTASSGDFVYLYSIIESNNTFKVAYNIELNSSGTASSGLRIQDHCGDVLYITDFNFPDFWFMGGANDPFELSRLETIDPIIATYDVAGIVKLGNSAVQTTSANNVSTTNNRTYAVQLDSNQRMVVNVPWVDNDHNTATAADNILDGSNDGTEITYAPYSSRGAGHLYTGDTAPQSTNRLNYDGKLYVTDLYIDSGNSSHEPTQVVSLAKAQTITGAKTFSGSNTFSGATSFSGNITTSTGTINIQQSSITLGTGGSVCTITLPTVSGTVALLHQTVHTYIQSGTPGTTNIAEGSLWFQTSS